MKNGKLFPADLGHGYLDKGKANMDFLSTRYSGASNGEKTRRCGPRCDYGAFAMGRH